MASIILTKCKERNTTFLQSMSLKRPRSLLNPLPEGNGSHKRPLIESRDKSPGKSTESDFGELKIDDSFLLVLGERAYNH